MDKMAKILAELIDKRGSRRAFAEEIGIPPTTLQSMLTRGLGRASVNNVIKVCRALGITVEQLEEMANNENYDVETIAAHRTDDLMDELPEEARKSLEEFKMYLLKKHGIIKE